MTVCALPSRDLQISAVLAPWADASIAARSPAPPAPMMSTSYSCVSYLLSRVIVLEQNQPWIDDDSSRDEAHVEVRQRYPKQTDPREPGVEFIQAIREEPQPKAQLCDVENVQVSAHEIST